MIGESILVPPPSLESVSSLTCNSQWAVRGSSQDAEGADELLLGRIDQTFIRQQQAILRQFEKANKQAHASVTTSRQQPNETLSTGSNNNSKDDVDLDALLLDASLMQEQQRILDGLERNKDNRAGRTSAQQSSEIRFRPVPRAEVRASEATSRPRQQQRRPYNHERIERIRGQRNTSQPTEITFRPVPRAVARAAQAATAAINSHSSTSTTRRRNSSSIWLRSRH